MSLNPSISALGQRFHFTYLSDEALSVEGKQVAEIYENIVHSPFDDKVQHSYAVLLKALTQQFLDAQGFGLTVTESEESPYSTSREMFEDIDRNHHLLVLSSEESMEGLPQDHPMMTTCPVTGLMYNIVFRAVHDLYGHYAGRFSFSDRGERSAWLQHMRTIPVEGHVALFCETRGQNAWTNHYADHSSQPASQRPFPTQKAGMVDLSLLPETARSNFPKS